MDYLELVLKGFFDPNDRLHLSNYYFREFKKAEKDHYKANVFFEGCLAVINSFTHHLDQKLQERKTELYFMLARAKSKESSFINDNDVTKTFEQKCEDLAAYCNEELSNIGLHNFTVHLSSITKNRFCYNMSYEEVKYLYQTINDAYQEVKKENEAPIKEKNIKVKLVMIYVSFLKDKLL